MTNQAFPLRSCLGRQASCVSDAGDRELQSCCLVFFASLPRLPALRTSFMQDSYPEQSTNPHDTPALELAQ